MCRITTIVYFYSYQCGGNYHAPTDCETIKRWLTKCADDSETANYISAHTKDVSFFTKLMANYNSNSLLFNFQYHIHAFVFIVP